jgi:hypothetical protein
MTLEQLANLAEIVGSIGVIITLIYLARQIRQNTRALNGATMQAVTADVRDELKWFAQNSDLFTKGKNEDERLTPQEHDHLLAWFIGALRARQNEFFQHRDGLLDDSVWKSHRAIIHSMFDNPWATEWWRDMARHVLAGEFCDFVDDLLKEQQAVKSGLHGKGSRQERLADGTVM